jgi:hypothetical protein
MERMTATERNTIIQEYGLEDIDEPFSYVPSEFRLKEYRISLLPLPKQVETPSDLLDEFSRKKKAPDSEKIHEQRVEYTTELTLATLSESERFKENLATLMRLFL